MSAPGDRYDQIGRSYASTRRQDPRIAEQIRACLGAARSVVNVGAGSGNYEPEDRAVVAVEPSVAMLGQRHGRPAPTVRAVAEALPFDEAAFDAALAVLTIHHWSDPAQGLSELRRISRRQVVFFFRVQAGMSWLAMLPDDARRRGTERLAADLASGAWDRRLGHLRHEQTFDGGYRIAIVE